MEQKSASRFASIEGARAIMALWVVWGHLVQQAGLYPKWAEGWEAARDPSIPVFVFMMISGFVITHLIVEKRETYPAYIARRFFRLAPLLWVCIGFILAYDLFFPKVYQWDDTHTRDYLLGYASMLHAVVPEEIVPDMARSILPPAWSISLEWQFYLLAPLLLWRRAWPALILVGICAVFVTRNSITEWTGLTFDPGFLPITIGYFLVGIGSYYLARHLKGMIIPTWALVAGALAMFAMTKGSWPLAIWVVVLGAAVSPNFIRSALESRVMLWLGAISYSIYLTHMIVIMAVRKQVVEGALGLEFGTWTHLWTMTAICIPMIIFASAITWFCIERPGQKFGTWLAKRLTLKSSADNSATVAVPIK